MAYGNFGLVDSSRAAAADFRLEANQYRFVVFDAAGLVALAGNGVACDGVLLNRPNTGEQAKVMISDGICPIRSAAALAINAEISSSANGRAEAPAATEFVQGKVLEASGAADQVVTAFIQFNRRVA